MADIDIHGNRRCAFYLRSTRHH